MGLEGVYYYLPTSSCFSTLRVLFLLCRAFPHPIYPTPSDLLICIVYTYATQRVWNGRFLALLHGELPEPVILELEQ